MTAPPKSRQPNRLVEEKSPYLQQHAYNPVDWYPWGDEAFERARVEDKPIFLSIGYSTCHWCHVMERESFEDEATADFLNRNFVSIKVDREERPDVDHVYMTALQALQGGGGWPLSAFLTPELEPFFTGTYFPPEPRWGQPAFQTLLLRLHEAWSTQREVVANSARQVSVALERLTATDPLDGSGPELDFLHEALEAGYSQFSASYDDDLAGFGSAPKFPRPTVLLFLLRYARRRDDERARSMALDTLRAMWRGGLQDHLGGGYHRYSVDRHWRVSHFEKMLYDQAQLALAYCEAHQVTGETFFADATRTLIGYVLRDLGHPGGGFYSAEDADSAPDPDYPSEKEEGAFYLWEMEEIGRRLEPRDAELVARVYGLRAEGNTLSDPHGELGSRNVLYLAMPLEEAARELGLDPDRASDRLANAMGRLYQARAKRPRPHRDEKIITAWNGLMVAALARAGAVLGEGSWIQAARSAADFVLTNSRPDGVLRRRWSEGEAAHPGQLDDHAALALGLLELHEATGEARWILQAAELVDATVERFHDPVAGAFWDSVADPRVLVRSKQAYDGAEPSGNALLAQVLLRLGWSIDRPQWVELGESVLRVFRTRLVREAQVCPFLLCAADFAIEPPTQVVLRGAPVEPGNPLLAAAHRPFAPNRTILWLTPALGPLLGEHANQLLDTAGSSGTARPEALICRHFSCERPTRDPEDLVAALSAR